MSQSLVPGVTSGEVEKVRLAIVALEAEGQRPTSRAVRARAGIGAAAVTAVMKAVASEKLPPAAAGPWTTAPWARADDAKRRAEDARDLRQALHALLELVHDEWLPDAATCVHGLVVDLRRVARAYGIEEKELALPADPGEHPAVTVGAFLERLRGEPGAP